ncbi:MAG TPA: phosphoadenylyl-sulfate reductase [Kofleriaceae bacterium]|nr:phosphoadenylyl-sulfate reductase [Kofleriaceae bacterium]
MHVTMVKKRLATGEPCRKCAQTEEMLRQRGLWDRIDEVVWAVEGDPQSPGMVLGQRFGVEQAPFFLVSDDTGQVSAYRSALQLIREKLQPSAPQPSRSDTQRRRDASAAAAAALESAAPEDVLRWGLERFGTELAIAFSGSDDVALIHMAAKMGLPFSIISVDTGRLHAETYAFLEEVRTHYGVELIVPSPDPVPLEALVRRKGLFSFYQDGHDECCSVRKVEPLRRVLSSFRAWATGQRRDQNAATRAALPVIEEDPVFGGVDGALVKLNPLARWTHDELWDYLRRESVPVNPLHERGFASIGCAPCTRAIAAGQSERDGRWWWEAEDRKECGLHAGNLAHGVG